MPQNGFLSDWIVALSCANHLGLQTRLSGRYISPLVKGGRGEGYPPWLKGGRRGELCAP